MNNLSRIFILCLSLTATVSFADSNELAQRDEIINTVRNAFIADDFAKLEQLSTTFRQERSRTASGIWKLSLFYAGIQGIMNSKEKRDEKYWRNLEAKARAWMAAYPQSPSAPIVYSHILINHGWNFRGGNYARNVPAEAWEPFYRYIDLSRKNLEKNKATASIDPGWYEAMMSVARAQGWEREKFDALLNEALDKEPSFYQTYFFALEYLLPKWHGGIEEIEEFANYAVAKTSRVEGQGMYARIYWFASQTQFDDDLFRNSLAAWPKMKAGFEDIVARYPDAWNVNNYAKFSCLAFDKVKTRELMSKIAGKPMPEAWKPIEAFHVCQEWAFQS